MSSKKRRRLTPRANAIATDAVQLIRERMVVMVVIRLPVLLRNV